MANSVHIVRTVFQDVNSKKEVVETSYGVRVFDDYGSQYSNFVGSLDELAAMTNDEVIDLARSINEAAADTISFAIEDGHSIFIDDELYMPTPKPAVSPV